MASILAAQVLGCDGGGPATADTPCLSATQVTALLDSVETRYGVVLDHTRGTNAIPELWRIPPANGVAGPISAAEFSCAVGVIAAGLEKYPAGLARAHLSSIHVVDDLYFNGVEYAGTLLGDRLFLSIGAQREGDGLAATFHHEMSSVIYREFDFPTEDWMRLNPPGFLYIEEDDSVIELMREESLLSEHSDWFRRGFLSEYATTTMENDFNLFAEMLMVKPDKLEQLANEFPAIRAKQRLTQRVIADAVSSAAAGGQGHGESEEGDER